MYMQCMCYCIQAVWDMEVTQVKLRLHPNLKSGKQYDIIHCVYIYIYVCTLCVFMLCGITGYGSVVILHHFSMHIWVIKFNGTPVMISIGRTQSKNLKQCSLLMRGSKLKTATVQGSLACLAGPTMTFHVHVHTHVYILYVHVFSVQAGMRERDSVIYGLVLLQLYYKDIQRMNTHELEI